MLKDKSGIGITENITIYTVGGYPYGGAAENFVRQMALGLNAANASVNVVLLRGSNVDNNTNDTGIDCNYMLFKKRFRSELFKFAELLLQILIIPISLLRNRIHHKTKIVLLYAIEYFYLVLPFYLVGRLLGIKVFRIIVDRNQIHNISPSWWKFPKVFFYRIQYLYIDKYLSGLVCISQYLRESAILHGVKADKICIIPNFLELERFSKVSSVITPFQAKKIRFGFCGTLNEGNGLFILLQAFRIVYSKNKNIELCLIGYISENDILICEKILNGLTKSVIFTGKVMGDAVPDWLASCDILINPRISGVYSEAGFPTKLGEYMATKKPIVATAVGDLKLYFKNGDQLILVEPDSPQALADGILFLLSNQHIGIQTGQNGYLWAKAHLDNLTNAKKMLSFIHNV